MDQTISLLFPLFPNQDKTLLKKSALKELCTFLSRVIMVVEHIHARTINLDSINYILQ